MRHQLTATEDHGHDNDREGVERDPSGFVPLDARLQPWETVMSGLRYRDPDQAAAIDILSVKLQLTPEELLARLGVDERPVLPDLPDETEYERRARLRRERKRLVGILHHQTGRDYREIQQETNEIAAAGRSVNDHTISELEAAIRLLTRQLADSGGLPVGARPSGSDAAAFISGGCAYGWRLALSRPVRMSARRDSAPCGTAPRSRARRRPNRSLLGGECVRTPTASPPAARRPVEQRERSRRNRRARE